MPELNSTIKAQPASGPSAQPPSATPAFVEGLRSALAAEHAAIFAYGRLGVLLSSDRRAEAQRAEAAHRSRRDGLLIQLDELRATPAPAAPGYELPFPLTDPVSAQRLAAEVEEAVAATWRAAVPLADGAARQGALTAYSAAAVQAARWRRLAGITPVTTPFPGRPA